VKIIRTPDGYTLDYSRELVLSRDDVVLRFDAEPGEGVGHSLRFDGLQVVCIDSHRWRVVRFLRALRWVWAWAKARPDEVISSPDPTR
jgi:hypothetical protein